MTPQPPPTDEQFEMVERSVAYYRRCGLVTEANAFRAVLDYARLGVRAADVARANEAGHQVLLTAADLRLLAPAVETKEKQGHD